MKNFTRLIAAFLFLMTTNLFGQYTLDWMQSAGADQKKSVMSAVDSEDNIIVAGYWPSYQMFTRKYSISGALLWEVADASGINSIYEKANWVNCDADNNVFVVGNQYAIGGSVDYPNAIIAVKYSPSGTLLWKTTIPIAILPNNQVSFNCRSVMDENGNLYIATAIVNGVFLYKLDTNGNLVFTTSSSVNAPINFNAMRIRNNKIAVATSSGTFNVAPIFVWDTSGTLLWTANANGLLAADVEIDEDENVYVLSAVMTTISPITIEADAKLAKFDAAGNLVWEHVYDFGGHNFTTRMTYLNNRISAIGYGTATGINWVTFQTDTSGTLLWSAIYDAPTGSDEYPYHILAKPNGEVIVTGVGGPSPDPFSPSFNQMPIVQYSDTGVQNWISTPNIYGGTGLVTALASDGSLFATSSRNMYVYHYNADALAIGDNPVPGKVIVAPNPFSDNVTLKLGSFGFPSKVTIFDLSGKALRTMTLEGENEVIDLSTLAIGIYFCQITSSSNIETVKIIKRD